MSKGKRALAACALAVATLCAPALPLAQEDVRAGTANLAGAALVELGTQMSALPPGVRAQDGVVTVEAAGVYAFTGTLDGGQIVVDAGGKDEVTLILNGVSITNDATSAILVKNARLTTILLAEDSQNRVQSGETAALDGSAIDADAQGGAITAKDDLAIAGEGALFVGGYLNNGIHAKNALTISGGEIAVEAVNNGVKGKDAVTVSGGRLTVRAGHDGVVSDGEDGEGYGVICVSGGSLKIESAQDAMQAETVLDVTGGAITVVAGGGSANAAQRQSDGRGFGGFMDRGGMGGRGMGGGFAGRGGRGDARDNAAPDGDRPDGAVLDGGMPDGGIPGNMPGGGMPGGEMPEGMPGGEAPDGKMPDFGMDGGFPGEAPSAQDTETSGSAKGLKAGTLLRISGGTIEVDAADDALHANGSVEITGGALTLATGDDGIHADESLTIDGGTVRVTASYEGLEANQIRISDGTVEVTATDDGINANGGQAFWGRRGAPDGDQQTDGEMPNLLITGGTVYVNAQGDGLDSNGNLLVEGGLVVVDGPSDSGNGALDAGTESGGACEVHGGTVLAIGSRGMAETFGSGSTQVSFEYSFAQNLPAGSLLTIAAEDGTILFEHTAAKAFASVVFSSPQLALGETLTLTAGEQSAQVTLDAVASQSGNQRGWGWR